MKPYYSDDSVTIYHADCREILPQLTAHALVTDPPYGVNLGNHYRAKKNGSTYKGLQKDGYASYQDTTENFEQIIAPAIWMALDRVEAKKTCLWLKGLPLLVHTNVLPTRNGNPNRDWDNQTPSGQNKLGPSPTRAAQRAKTYIGIADSMAT